jgi:hypothetical protein
LFYSLSIFGFYVCLKDKKKGKRKKEKGKKRKGKHQERNPLIQIQLGKQPRHLHDCFETSLRQYYVIIESSLKE